MLRGGRIDACDPKPTGTVAMAPLGAHQGRERRLAGALSLGDVADPVVADDLDPRWRGERHSAVGQHQVLNLAVVLSQHGESRRWAARVSEITLTIV